jgi:translocation and assembly module TamB
MAVAAALLALVAAGGYAFLRSQAGVDFAMRELVRRSGGALEIVRASGSLLDTVHVERATWRGPDTRVVAEDVALTWSPAALFSRAVSVRGLSVRALSLEFAPAQADLPLPASLALPLEVAIERVGIGELAWRVGPNGGTIRGIAFGYAGGAAAHRVRDLALATDPGTLSGDLALAARPPFAISGRLGASGAAALQGARADATLGGTLAHATIEGHGAWGKARASLRAVLAPLAVVVLRDVALDVTDLDLAERAASLPSTQLAGEVRAKPIDGGLAGTIDARNAVAGTLDGSRVPLDALAARFTWRGGALALDDLVASVPGGGRVTGSGVIPLDRSGGAGRWSAEVRDVDLRRIYGPLVATRLSGAVTADLDARPQRFGGAIVDRGIAGGVALDFAATLADAVVTIERFRARGGSGELAGTARVGLSGERPFALDATASKLDPARFADVPAGSLDGRITVAGALAPRWRAQGEATLAPGSRFTGVPLAGIARGSVAADAIRDAVVTLAVGHAKLRVAGNAGAPDDRLHVALDAPDLAELAPLLPAGFPHALGGALRVDAQLQGLPPRGGFVVAASGTRLRYGQAFAAGKLELHATLAPGSGSTSGRDSARGARMHGVAARAGADADAAAGGVAAGNVGVDRIIATIAQRDLRLAIAASEIEAPLGKFRSLRADVDGTLERHALSLALAGDEIDVDARARGGVTSARKASGGAGIGWTGTLESLANRGAWALRLTAPAPIEASRTRLRIGAAQLEVADGSVHVAEAAWEDGRLRTQGRFVAVPLATAARMAGVTLPFTSTLTLGGEWSLAATPRLNGTLAVRREGGDVWLMRSTALAPAGASGLSRFEASARIADDAIDAKASFRSSRAGSADATLAIAAVPGAPPGRIAPEAPLELAASGTLPTLQLLQPWIGTAFAVDGRARFDLAARGTRRVAPLTGTLVAEDLRIVAPQYGLHLTDGRFAGRADGGRIIVDELTLRAGAGVFRASGEIAELAPGAARPTGRLVWQAERFRVLNRPDLRLVVDGEGTVTTREGRLAVAGRLRVDEGNYVYVPAADATLGDDVVVKGWPGRGRDTRAEGDVALDVDLAVDLGRKLRFSGEGLETGLVGEVRVTGGPGGLQGKGSIRAVNGTYFAFGQRLDIDRGRLVFDGRLDNPGLDIVALRRNVGVEAGVAVSGTVKVPIVQLTSNPPVPDSEKLSWLVLGHGLDAGATGTDYAMLQAASAALLSRDGKPFTTTVARSLGLDDILVRSASGPPRGADAGAQDAAGQVVVVGKRLSKRLSLIYEQGLTVATNALRLEYALTRALTLRAEAGTISGVGIYFRRTFD